jgi:hypothetical protein
MRTYPWVLCLDPIHGNVCLSTENGDEYFSACLGGGMSRTYQQVTPIVELTNSGQFLSPVAHNPTRGSNVFPSNEHRFKGHGLRSVGLAEGYLGGLLKLTDAFLFGRTDSANSDISHLVKPGSANADRPQTGVHD